MTEIITCVLLGVIAVAILTLAAAINDARKKVFRITYKTNNGDTHRILGTDLKEMKLFRDKLDGFLEEEK